jgi:hypothetical protein
VADYAITIDPHQLDPHPGALLTDVLARLQLLLDRTHQEPTGDPAIRQGLDTRWGLVWEMSNAFDPLYREAAAALSAGPRDFSTFARERAMHRLRIAGKLRDLLDYGLPKGKTICIIFRCFPEAYSDRAAELGVLTTVGNWHEGDKDSGPTKLYITSGETA